jgi:hypothetical protein
MSALLQVSQLSAEGLTQALIPLLGGEPVDHGLRLVAVSDVEDGQAIAITVADAGGARRRLRILVTADPGDRIPPHYRPDGIWCEHSDDTLTTKTPICCPEAAPAAHELSASRARS